MTANSVLFISYDGLLDPLGPSQILPYLYGIVEHPRRVHILSFEKPSYSATEIAALRARLGERGIDWTPLTFTARGRLGVLSKLWDLVQMYAAALALQLRWRFGVIHCRGYAPMQVGCLLHRLSGAMTLFDMRGLWPDERIDGGIWNQARWFDRRLYRHYKRLERRLLACATQIIALTERVVPELRRIYPGLSAPVTVIPCCADFDHFTVPTTDARRASRHELGIPADARVISYLGSLGTWYLLEEMLRFFAAATRRWDNVHLLLITRDWMDEQEALLDRMDLTALRQRIHIRSATRDQVPAFLAASDVMLSFIKPAYSKVASSPTKLAEAFAMGIPVISNSGVGDIDEMEIRLDAGTIINLADWADLKRGVDELDMISAKGGPALRERARQALGLEIAHEAYRQVYASLDEAGS